ncbi:MAG: ribonucleoside-diphosphate reductase, adenosylcobalamin-dependent, partial [Fidelibacterota bacterium]
GLYSEKQLRNIEKQVMENTQVRFANISIKASDEFMQAVDEQRNYGNDKYLVYKKLEKELVMTAPQNDSCHYSSGIPSKDPSKYELIKTFSSFTEMNNWMFQEYGVSCRKNDLEDANKRDVYGDLVYQLDESKFDLAVKQAGDFLLYFSSIPTGEIRELVKARDIWDQFIEGNYKTAEPGLIFWSTMSRYSPSNYVDRPIISTNPCAEVPLEDGGACNLGSINLSRFVKDGYTEQATIDWDQLADTTRTLVRFLDNVVTWNEQLNALEKQRLAAAETRRLGLGIMGAADMLNQLGISYDSDEGIEIMGQLMSFIANASYQASAGLSEEKGESPIFNQNYLKCPFVKEALSSETRKIIKEKGIRNIAILSIAPTGTISNIVLGYRSEHKNYIGVSGGIEPIFALYYTRRSESFGNQMFKVFHSTVNAYIDKMEIRDLVDKSDDLESILPKYFSATSHRIDPAKRVKIQGYCQKYIDHSISSTVNLSEDVEPEVISDIYIQAWKNNLKGITIYRDGSRFPILSTDGKKTPFQDDREKTFKIASPDGTETQCKGDEILKLPNGDLTTVYHFIHKYNSDINIEPHTSLLEEIGSDQTN